MRPRRTLGCARHIQAKPGGPPELREPKYGFVRDVYILDELVPMLSRHVEIQGVSSEGWLFFTGAGRPLPPSTVTYWWLRTCQAAGVEGLHLHPLRHFYALGLIAEGCDVVTVQRALGHSSRPPRWTPIVTCGHRRKTVRGGPLRPLSSPSMYPPDERWSFRRPNVS